MLLPVVCTCANYSNARKALHQTVLSKQTGNQPFKDTAIQNQAMQNSPKFSHNSPPITPEFVFKALQTCILRQIFSTYGQVHIRKFTQNCQSPWVTVQYSDQLPPLCVSKANLLEDLDVTWESFFSKTKSTPSAPLH